MTIKMVIVALAAAAGCGQYAHVGSGEVAVVRTPEGLANRVYATGDWDIGWHDHAVMYNARSQEHAEQLSVQAADGLGISLDTSIRFHIIPNETVALHRELGEHYYDVLVGPTLRSAARRVVGRYKPEEIYSSQREQIEREITDGVTAAIKGRHVEIEAVLVRGVKLPEPIEMAINNKLEAEQQSLKMKFVLAQQEQENEQHLSQTRAEAERAKIAGDAAALSRHVAAEAEADSVRVAAQAAADAKRIDAEATADYERTVQPHLTKEVLRLKEIEANTAIATSPNTKLVIGGGNAGRTVVDLRGIEH